MTPHSCYSPYSTDEMSPLPFPTVPNMPGMSRFVFNTDQEHVEGTPGTNPNIPSPSPFLFDCLQGDTQVLRGDLQHLAQRLGADFQFLRDEYNVLLNEVTDLRRAAMQLTVFNDNLYKYAEDLHIRMHRLEDDNMRLRADVQGQDCSQSQSATRKSILTYRGASINRSRSPSYEHQERDTRMDPGQIDHNDGVAVNDSPHVVRKPRRPQLQVRTALGGPPSLLGPGLPTPATSGPPTGLGFTFPGLDSTMQCPANETSKRPLTMILKRRTHNLGEKMAPINVQIPLLPLNDTEIVAFFYNSVKRPIVALRLYARGWGPAKITNALNHFRAPDPPYLRNTCSVKCTTAIKRGTEQFGQIWYEEKREAFKDADDCEATDMIRMTEQELGESQDLSVLDVAQGLVNFPDGPRVGAFTRCVKYCVEQKISLPLSEVHELALQLELNTKNTTSPVEQSSDKIEEDDDSSQAFSSAKSLTPSTTPHHVGLVSSIDSSLGRDEAHDEAVQDVDME